MQPTPSISSAISLNQTWSFPAVMEKLPLIGITMSHSVRNGSPYDYVNRSYLNAVESAGGVPVPLPNVDAAAELVEMCDGILFTGGGDVHPKHYGEEINGTDPASVEEIRDSTERVIFNRVREKGVPVFGICRGIQSLNVFAGGTLIQDISLHSMKANGTHPAISHRQVEDRHHPSHSIRIKPGTRLYAIQGRETRNVNSIHHQAVLQIPDGWIVSALAEDGIVEAIERPGPSFMLAVQWHPEELAAESDDDHRLFKAFVSESSAYSASKK